MQTVDSRSSDDRKLMLCKLGKKNMDKDYLVFYEALGTKGYNLPNISTIQLHAYFTWIF